MGVNPEWACQAVDRISLHKACLVLVAKTRFDYIRNWRLASQPDAHINRRNAAALGEDPQWVDLNLG